jgi:hypothetical protein
MNELLLQTIVEKLEALEIVLFKKTETPKDDTAERQLLDQVKNLHSEFERFKAQMTENNYKLNKLTQNFSALDNSKQNRVKHIHHFHDRLWLTVSIYLISLLFAYGWINCHNEKKAFEANDLKYRYWKVNPNKSLLKASYYTDSLYNLDKDGFEKKVLSRERRLLTRSKEIDSTILKKMKAKNSIVVLKFSY